ncbi:MAG: transglutaminase family protein [Candidatus Levybacteria bacterium]|nr:transglutaminase family protein [Candidatus Levybacteria bacterium]
MKNTLFTALFFFLFFFIVPLSLFADESFSIASDITYSVKEDELTHVVINTSLTNKTSEYYASQNAIKVGFSSIENVKASDPDGAITPEIIKEKTGYTIKVHFNKRVVGIDKTLPFTIEFDTPDIVEQQGTIYEVDIPGIADQNDYSTFNVHVRVPEYFGQPRYIKPNVGGTSLDFTKEQLGKGGISIAFGQNQMYDFSFIYHIDNTHVFPIRTEIALPPDTNYQEVEILSMDPKPLNVEKDRDGNWLAQYSLLPSEEKEVIVKGKIKVHLLPKEQPQTSEELAVYLLPKKYWDVKSKEIQELAQTLKTPQAIYAYVLKTLSYDFSRVTERKVRLGGAIVLQNPTSAVCLEFTDLFISLSRAAGIPAREVDGFGYTKNGTQRPVSLEDDILHAWPEYYDSEKKTWIMVDPTWGNTTKGVDYFDVLDFSHIAFVIKGHDSSYPVPAGGYKLPGRKIGKDVIITPVVDTSFSPPDAQARIAIDQKIFAGISPAGFLHVVNPSGTRYPNEEITIVSDYLLPKEQKITIPEILPFGYADIPFRFEAASPFAHKSGKITVLIGNQRISETVTIVPFYIAAFQKPLLPITIGGGVIFATITIIIWLIAKRPRGVSVL